MGAMPRLTIWSTSELMLNRAVTADVTSSAENNGTVINKVAERFVSPGLRNDMRRYPDYGNAPRRTMNRNFGIIGPDSGRDDSDPARAGQARGERGPVRQRRTRISRSTFGRQVLTRRCRLPHAAGIDDRAGITLELLAQLIDLVLVGEEIAVVVGDLVRQDRLVARRWRHVAARRPGRQLGLLLRRQQPRQEQFRRVRMRRVLEDGAQQRPDRQRVAGREMRLHRLALALQPFGDVEDGIERDEVLARADAALLAEMALNERRLLRHVLVHVAPAVFLHDVIEYPQRDVVVSRIGGDDLALELRFEEIRGRVRDVS